jgi:GT2 family glycosyltransferase
MDDTLECLRSVYELEYLNYEVVVVDNCSTDGSITAIESAFPQVILIKNSKNIGYTGGNNVGIRYGLENGGEYFWLLNNDTVVRPDTLNMLVDTGEREQKVGLISPSIYYYDEPDKVQFIGAYVDTDNLAVVPVTDPKQLEDIWLQKNLVLYGTALLIKRAVIESIGLLPEKYFAYHEDCHYSLKALKNNFRTAVLLESRILHKESRTTGKLSPIQVFLRTRNIFFLCSDNSRGFKRKIQITSRYISNMLSYAKYLFEEGKEESCTACVKGVWSALIRRGGGYDPMVETPGWFKALFTFFMIWHPYFWTNLFKGNVRGIVREALVRVQAK